MNQLSPVLAFYYGKAQADARLLPTHQSLFLALFFVWRQSGCTDLFTISRKELMPMARLQSIATYHKCIKELKAFGYIEYHPTYNYYRGSKVRLLNGEERSAGNE
jgi:hypothetical protein